MFRHKKTLVTWCLIIVLVMSPFTALAEAVDEHLESNRSPEAMTVDIFLVRPLSLVATAGGVVVFLVSSPFSALGGNTHEAWHKLVAEPAKFTFQRPLGHFKNSR